MATTPKRPARKTSRRPRTSEQNGVTMIDMGDGDMQPDVIAFKTANSLKWHEVPSALKKALGKWDLDEPNTRRLSWRQEIILDPSLKFTATPESVVAASENGLRWERIAIRTGLGVTAIKKMYEDGSKLAADSRYVGKGRRWDPMVPGGLPVGYKSHMTFDKANQKWVEKDGASTETPAKRTPRKAGSKRPARKTTRRTTAS